MAVDGRRIAKAVVAVCLATLTVLAVVLLVVGLQKNAQINELRSNGVTIAIRVSACQGLLGGSGSNAAGYACRGTYTFRGHRYDEAIPGTVLLAPGSSLKVVIAPNDPALLSTVDAVRNEHPSWRVFIAPAVLALLALGATAVLLLRRRGSGGVRRDRSATATSVGIEVGVRAPA